ncbi:MAG TPA: hypothetical protein VFN80_07120 [Acidothermaceae bacterium]|nr:hypothetical protein [Acidothermaceae bacterium]
MSDPSNPYEPAPPVSGGQGPGPGSPYGAPMQPAGYGAPPPPVGPAPSSVVNATRLMFVSAALGVIGLIVLLASKNSLRDQVAKKNPEYDAHKLDTVVNAAVAVGIVLGVIFIVLYVLLALQVQKGKNWARIVTWVLAAIGVLSALASLAQTNTGGSRATGLIGGVIDLAIIILLAQKASNDYFRRRTY